MPSTVPYSILIVDDSEADRYLLKRMISATKLEVQIYEEHNGVEALEFLKDYHANLARYGEDFPPCLCFLDVNMPLMNGWEFLAAWEEHRQQAEVDLMTVVMLSSSSDLLEQKKIGDYAFVDGFLVKGEVSIDIVHTKIVTSSERVQDPF